MSYCQAGGNCLSAPPLIFNPIGGGPYVYFSYVNFGGQNGNGLFNLIMFG